MTTLQVLINQITHLIVFLHSFSAPPTTVMNSWTSHAPHITSTPTHCTAVAMVTVVILLHKTHKHQLTANPVLDILHYTGLARHVTSFSSVDTRNREVRSSLPHVTPVETGDC